MLQALHQPRALVGEAQLPGGSLHQADTQALLQSRQALGQHRGMALQHPAGGSERAVLVQRQQGGKFIGLTAVERVHR
jgi:hypothetical protein